MKLVAFGNRVDTCVDKLGRILAKRLVKIGRLNRGPCPRYRLLVIAKLREFSSDANSLTIVAGPIRFFDFREFGFHDNTLSPVVWVASELPKIPRSG